MFLKHHEYSCKICGMKAEDFVFTQRVGCPYCYLFLEKSYKNLLPNIQDGSSLHIGKKTNKNILYHFFIHILDKKIEEDPSKLEDCEKLKKIISDYF